MPTQEPRRPRNTAQGASPLAPWAALNPRQVHGMNGLRTAAVSAEDADAAAENMFVNQRPSG